MIICWVAVRWDVYNYLISVTLTFFNIVANMLNKYDDILQRIIELYVFHPEVLVKQYRD